MAKVMPETGPLTVTQVAKKTGASIWRVFRWIHSGDLPATDLGSGRGGKKRGHRPTYSIDRADLQRFIDSRKVQRADSPAPTRRPEWESKLVQYV